MADNDNLPPVPAALEKWRSEGTVKDIDGLQVFVHTSGPESDHGVLIVHGYPGSSWDWQGVVDRIGDQARVVVPDMRGFGMSEKPLDGTYKEYYTLMLQADLYEAVAKETSMRPLPKRRVSPVSCWWPMTWARPSVSN